MYISKRSRRYRIYLIFLQVKYDNHTTITLFNQTSLFHLHHPKHVYLRHNSVYTNLFFLPTEGKYSTLLVISGIRYGVLLLPWAFHMQTYATFLNFFTFVCTITITLIDSKVEEICFKHFMLRMLYAL